MATSEIQKNQAGTPERNTARPTVAPRVDIYENRDQFLVVADLPGVRSDDLSIHVENAELTLTAQRRTAPLGTEVARERVDADYRRTFLLPQGIDREKIDAELKDGVLRLTLPKADAHRPRQIPVRAA